MKSVWLCFLFFPLVLKENSSSVNSHQVEPVSTGFPGLVSSVWETKALTACMLEATVMSLHFKSRWCLWEEQWLDSLLECLRVACVYHCHLAGLLFKSSSYGIRLQATSAQGVSLSHQLLLNRKTTGLVSWVSLKVGCGEYNGSWKITTMSNSFLSPKQNLGNYKSRLCFLRLWTI